MRTFLIMWLLCARAVAGGPVFTAGPDKAFNCTHYFDNGTAKPGEPMDLRFPVDKVVKFKLAARASKKGEKVAFSLVDAPPAAKLNAASFEWKVEGKPGQTFKFDVVATEDAGTTHWPLVITIAEQKLFTAWSAGLGSVWPDCSVVLPDSYEVRDLDHDGRDDVSFSFKGEVYDGRTEHTTRLMIQRGAPMKFVKLECIDCTFTPYVTNDGTHLFVSEGGCCCQTMISIDRVDESAITALNSFTVPTTASCGPQDHEVTWALTVDKHDRVVALVIDGQKLPWDKATRTFH